MGLDMYLYKKYYVKNWDHMEPAELHKITIRKGGKASKIPTDKISDITTQEIYWRKANAIHKWFVDHCQGGVDDCRDAYVSRAQLEELLSTVEKVLAASLLVKGKVTNGFTGDKNGFRPVIEQGMVIKDSSVAAKLLPAASGFFFGTTEYDQYYHEDLVHTRTELLRVLAEDKKVGGEFYYHSSW